MTVVNFNFTKIVAERKEAIRGKVNINNNVTILNVTETDLNLGKSKQKALKFEFLFTSAYDPKVGNISLGGEVIWLDEAAKCAKLLEQWKKEKKVESAVMANILNTVLRRSNVQALILSQDVNLPSPIQLPKVKVEQKQG